jgi:hypothetical protein
MLTSGQPDEKERAPTDHRLAKIDDRPAGRRFGMALQLSLLQPHPERDQ